MNEQLTTEEKESIVSIYCGCMSEAFFQVYDLHKRLFNKFDLTHSQCMRQMCPEAVAYDGNQTCLWNICISLDQSKSKNVLWEITQYYHNSGLSQQLQTQNVSTQMLILNIVLNSKTLICKIQKRFHQATRILAYTVPFPNIPFVIEPNLTPL